MDYDIAVIGGGPAGVSAAITASSKGRKVVLFEAHGFSPRLRSVAQITDYMGIPDVSGSELMDIFVKHLKHSGADIVEEKIISLREVGEGFVLGTPHAEYTADSVVLATGISRSTLIPGEKEFLQAVREVPLLLCLMHWRRLNIWQTNASRSSSSRATAALFRRKRKILRSCWTSRRKSPVRIRLPACVQATTSIA